MRDVTPPAYDRAPSENRLGIVTVFPTFQPDGTIRGEVEVQVVLTMSDDDADRVLAGVVDGDPVRIYDETSGRFWLIGRTAERRWCVVEPVPGSGPRKKSQVG